MKTNECIEIIPKENKPSQTKTEYAKANFKTDGCLKILTRDDGLLHTANALAELKNKGVQQKALDNLGITERLEEINTSIQNLRNQIDSLDDIISDYSQNQYSTLRQELLQLEQQLQQVRTQLENSIQQTSTQFGNIIQQISNQVITLSNNYQQISEQISNLPSGQEEIVIPENLDQDINFGITFSKFISCGDKLELENSILSQAINIPLLQIESKGASGYAVGSYGKDVTVNFQDITLQGGDSRGTKIYAYCNLGSYNLKKGDIIRIKTYNTIEIKMFLHNLPELEHIYLNSLKSNLVILPKVTKTVGGITATGATSYLMVSENVNNLKLSMIGTLTESQDIFSIQEVKIIES